MDQITIRGIPVDIERAIRKESEETQLSLNKTVINMLKRAVEAAEMKRPRKQKKYHDFSKYAGLWTDEEADEFNKFLYEEQRKIDEEMWK